MNNELIRELYDINGLFSAAQKDTLELLMRAFKGNSMHHGLEDRAVRLEGMSRRVNRLQKSIMVTDSKRT